MMAQKVNRTLDAAVDIILMSGGDVLNYAGDAIMALWLDGDLPSHNLHYPGGRAFESESMYMRCAAACCEIQRQISLVHEADDAAETIKIKIAIACGDININIYGKDSL